MKKSFIVTSILMACIFIIVGCDNLSPGTSVVNGITFERDAYTSPEPARDSLVVSRSIASSGALVDMEIDAIKTLLQSILPNGEITYLENGLGFTYIPTSGENWEITEDQWDEFEDKLDDVIVTIDGQAYEAEFDRQDTTGNIEVELDPIITYPEDFSTIKVIDDTTGREAEGVVLLAFQASGIEEYFANKYSGSWTNGLFTITGNAIEITENNYEILEDDFDDRFEEISLNGTEYEFGLEEPFSGVLIIEVELEEDDD